MLALLQLPWILPFADPSTLPFSGDDDDERGLCSEPPAVEITNGFRTAAAAAFNDVGTLCDMAKAAAAAAVATAISLVLCKELELLLELTGTSI